MLGHNYCLCSGRVTGGRYLDRDKWPSLGFRRLSKQVGCYRVGRTHQLINFIGVYNKLSVITVAWHALLTSVTFFFFFFFFLSCVICVVHVMIPEVEKK